MSSTIQPKLQVGRPDDRYEQEADRVADQVLRMPSPDTAHASLSSPVAVAVSVEQLPGAHLQRMCSACAEEKHAEAPRAEEVSEPEPEEPTGAAVDEAMPVVRPPEEALADAEELQPLSPIMRAKRTIQRMHGGASGAPNASSASLVGVETAGGGEPLDAAARAFFEPRFGRSFERVRVHTDTRASESTAAVHALAYTVGSEIVFASGEYAPGSRSGLQLLAHELTHVVQQDAAPARSRFAGTAAMAVQPGAVAARMLQRWSADGPAPASTNTIVCDGAGGVRVQIGTANDVGGLKCVGDCLRKHEESHRADALAANADVCKGSKDGSQVNFGAGEQKPSEIKASQAEIDCLNAKLPGASKECKPTIESRIKVMIAYRDSFK